MFPENKFLFLSPFVSTFLQLMRLYAHQLTEMLFILGKAGVTNGKVTRYLDDIQKVVAFYKKVSLCPTHVALEYGQLLKRDCSWTP